MDRGPVPGHLRRLDPGEVRPLRTDVRRTGLHDRRRRRSPAAVGSASELILVVANIGSAVVLFPVVKRLSEIGALGFVAARIMESVFICVGVLSVLTLVTLRQDAAGASAVDRAGVAPSGTRWSPSRSGPSTSAPGFVVGVGNGIILGYLMYRSGLVPRGMAMLGLVAGPMLCLSGAAIVLGIIDAGSRGRWSPPFPSSSGSSASACTCSSRGSGPRRSSPPARTRDDHRRVGSPDLRRVHRRRRRQVHRPARAGSPASSGPTVPASRRRCGSSSG